MAWPQQDWLVSMRPECQLIDALGRLRKPRAGLSLAANLDRRGSRANSFKLANRISSFSTIHADILRRNTFARVCSAKATNSAFPLLLAPSGLQPLLWALLRTSVLDLRHHPRGGTRTIDPFTTHATGKFSRNECAALDESCFGGSKLQVRTYQPPAFWPATGHSHFYPRPVLSSVAPC
jgi:hypothetical protein